MKVLFAGVARTVSNDRPSLRIVGLHHFLSSPSSFSTHLRVRSSVGSSISHKMADETHTRTHMSTVGVFALKVRFVFRMLKENLMKLVKEVLLHWGRARCEFHRE